MIRQIDALAWARPCQRPIGIPVGRPRGAKLAGIRYERSLANALPAAKHGQWFEFEDWNGRGFCQPDLLLGCDGICWVLEVKYSWTIDGHRQLEGLYLPVVARAIDRPVHGLVVCRRLTEGMKGVRVARSLDEARHLVMGGCRVAWHWLGTSQVEQQIAA